MIVGTPDYGRWQWRWIEWWYNLLLPGAHGQSHIEHYTAAAGAPAIPWRAQVADASQTFL